MVKLAHLFGQLQSKRVLVAGDLVLDRYIYGKSKRISPEAPVPVVSVESEEEKLGMVGNVALNLLALGMTPVLVSRVGSDAAGKNIHALLEQSLIEASGI